MYLMILRTTCGSWHCLHIARTVFWNSSVKAHSATSARTICKATNVHTWSALASPCSCCSTRSPHGHSSQSFSLGLTLGPCCIHLYRFQDVVQLEAKDSLKRDPLFLMSCYVVYSGVLTMTGGTQKQSEMTTSSEMSALYSKSSNVFSPMALVYEIASSSQEKLRWRTGNTSVSLKR